MKRNSFIHFCPLVVFISCVVIPQAALYPKRLVLSGESTKLNWDFNSYKIDGPTVSAILQDGQGDFDPWNRERWADWYDEQGRIIKPFELDTSVTFKKPSDPWMLTFSDRFEGKFFLPIVRQGIQVDGNGIVLDARTPDQKLPLEDLFALKKAAWSDGSCEIGGIFNNLASDPEESPTVVRNFTFKGLKRGVKVNRPNDLPGPDKEVEGAEVLLQHRLIVENCSFIRNRVGFYTNGYNTLLRNCQFFENGYGAIYSGSSSKGNEYLNNVFRDNTLSQHQHSYGDFIGDTFAESRIEDNRFLSSEIKGAFRRIGISFFRNMGEGGHLRKQIPHNNIIRNNFFDGYSVAINVGARMGRATRNDVSLEGRDYAFYNTIVDNTITNTTIGIKVNTEGNTIRHNTFRNVENDIVLQCVFFSLKNTTINDQKNDSVYLWYDVSDYPKYKKWFRFQDDRNAGIKRDEKYIEVFSNSESPLFPSESARFKVRTNKKKNELYDHRVGFPSITVDGEFSAELPGKEMIATWNKPISRVDGKDYYSILIFDKNGMEINRSGRSEIGWGQLVAFLNESTEDEMSIAAVPASPIDGKYPVYIFRRGYKEPETILYKDNTDPDIKISTTIDHQLRVDF